MLLVVRMPSSIIIDKLGGNSASRVELVQIDVTSDESLKNAVEAIKAEHGDSAPLYGLVNNAGGTSDSDDMLKVFSSNIYGFFSGRIVQISLGAAPSFVAK